ALPLSLRLSSFPLSLHDALPIFRMRAPITCAIVAGVSSLVLGSTQLPASSYLPMMLGRAPPLPEDAGQLYMYSFICRSMKERFRSEEHTSELQSRENLVCRLLLE